MVVSLYQLQCYPTHLQELSELTRSLNNCYLGLTKEPMSEVLASSLKGGLWQKWKRHGVTINTREREIPIFLVKVGFALLKKGCGWTQASVWHQSGPYSKNVPIGDASKCHCWYVEEQYYTDSPLSAVWSHEQVFFLVWLDFTVSWLLNGYEQNAKRR